MGQDTSLRLYSGPPEDQNDTGPDQGVAVRNGYHPTCRELRRDLMVAAHKEIANHQPTDGPHIQ